MTKPCPPILLAAASLFFFSCSRRLAYAATTEQQNEVKSILTGMEYEVKAFRDEIERVYKSRCDSQTLTECINNNYNDCSSTFPNQKCVKRDEFVMSDCGDGNSCNGECGATGGGRTMRSEL